MSKCYSSLRDDFVHTADDKEYRHSYAEESLNISIATQIKVLREQREMSQDALAREAGMKQSVISRYENVNYSSWSINSLRRLARVFDVDLDVKFRSFGELVKSVENFSRKALEVPSFTDDPFFKPLQPAAQPQMDWFQMHDGTRAAAGSAAWGSFLSSCLTASALRQGTPSPTFITTTGSATSAANPTQTREMIVGAERA